LIAARAGRLDSIRCRTHALEYGLDGHGRGGKSGSALTALEVRLMGDLILVRSAAGGGEPGFMDAWEAIPTPQGSRPLEAPVDIPVAADWKILVEQWLAADGGSTAEGWSARSYRALAKQGASLARDLNFVAPNHLIESRADGVTVLQVLPVAPGRALLRVHRYSSCNDPRPARAASYLAARLARHARPSSVALAESLQEGLVNFGHEAAAHAKPSSALSEFRRRLAALVPMMTLARPPIEP
jgi:phenylpropionate dioxygenase-like ring-hydroxylating dioxygenase large terminal subunit